MCFFLICITQNLRPLRTISFQWKGTAKLTRFREKTKTGSSDSSLLSRCNFELLSPPTFPHTYYHVVIPRMKRSLIAVYYPQVRNHVTTLSSQMDISGFRRLQYISGLLSKAAIYQKKSRLESQFWMHFNSTTLTAGEMSLFKYYRIQNVVEGGGFFWAKMVQEISICLFWASLGCDEWLEWWYWD